jgi:hypothetical protein
MANFKVFNYRDISSQDLDENLDMGEFTDGDVSSRQTKNIPTFNGEKLRFVTPWMFSRFGWGGKYDTITLQSSSKGKFPLDNSLDKKQFREFLNNIGTTVEKSVMEKPNPNNLNLSLSKQFSYDEKYGYYKYYFNIPKKHFDSEGEFEGMVFKSNDPVSPDRTPSSIKAIANNSYIEMVCYIGKITQTKSCVRYNIVVEQIHWCPGNGYIEKTEDEKIANNVDLFTNVPSLKKRKVTVHTDYTPSNEEDIEDLSESSKKVETDC